MLYAHCNHSAQRTNDRQMRGRAGRAVSLMEQSYGVCPSRASLSITVWPNFLRTE
jgi:hypothetical protein